MDLVWVAFGFLLLGWASFFLLLLLQSFLSIERYEAFVLRLYWALWCCFRLLGAAVGLSTKAHPQRVGDASSFTSHAPCSLRAG